MKKKFIIKDARRLLAEQINSSQIVEGKNMNIETMSKMKGLSEVIPKDNDGYCTVYKMDCADGLGLIRHFRVYSLSIMILKQRNMSGKVFLTRIFWKSTIVGKDVRGAAC